MGLMNKKTKPSKNYCENRAAFHDYEILETFEAGLALLGTEVKSVKGSGASLKEAYVRIVRGEVWLKLSYISHFSHGNIHNHEERRDRKLLLHRSEIQKLKKSVEQKGYTLIPLSLYDKRGKIKLSVAIAKGRKKFEKRAVLKEREQKREIERTIKELR